MINTMQGTEAWSSTAAAEDKSKKATGSTATSAAVLDSLMEKIRSRASTYKVWPDLMKMGRTAMLDKRVLVADATERGQLERCLETMQKNIKITSLQSLIDRLETITKQLGLKFHAALGGKDVFLSSDQYYVEVVLESAGTIKDVKIAHQTDPESCPELVRVLKEGDFVEFTRHMEGLSDIYRLNCEKKLKCKAYSALHSLENDLGALSQYSNIPMNDPNVFIHKSPVGLLHPRKGGHPMVLTFFVAPYDLIDTKSRTAVPLSFDLIGERRLGVSASVCIEPSDKQWRLQIQNLVTISHNKEGKSIPTFMTPSNLNSCTLPAYFILKLAKPLPLSMDVARQIHAITGIDWLSMELLEKREPLVALIAKQTLPEKERTAAQRLSPAAATFMGPFHAKLPDQEHLYNLNPSVGQMEGIPVTAVPFLHPNQVPLILNLLRQQVLFNVIMSSCMRKLTSFNSGDPRFWFEINISSQTTILITFEHPTEKHMAMMEMDLKDMTAIKCKSHCPSKLNSLCPDEYSSKVMQKSLSIPITMRAVITKCLEKTAALNEQVKQANMNKNANAADLYNFSSALSGSNGSTTDISYLSQQLLVNQFRQNGIDQIEGSNPSAFPSIQQQKQLQAIVSQLTRTTGTTAQQQQQILARQRNQLQQQRLNSQVTAAQALAQQKQNQMLMSMLSDTPAANNGNNSSKPAAAQAQLPSESEQMASVASLQQKFLQLQQQQRQGIGGIEIQEQIKQLTLELQWQLDNLSKPKKNRKRKGTSDVLQSKSPGSTGRSPKRKMSEDDYSRDLPTPSSGTDFLDSFGEQGSRPSSRASSSTPGLDSSGTPRSLDQIFPSVKQEAALSGADSSEILAYQMYQRSLPIPNASEFDEANFDGEFGSGPSSSGSSKSKKRNRKSSDSLNDISGSGLLDDNSKAQISSDDSSQSQPDLFAQPKLKGSRFPLGGDGRRCSSAGINDQPAKTNRFLNGPTDESQLLKKERKRKRAESVDSLKSQVATASGAVALNALMPPPLITSTGEMTNASGIVSPAAAYAFIEGTSNGAPALRPITLNVKPLVPSSTTAAESKSPSSSSTKKLTNAVSSSAPSVSTKMKLEAKLKAKNLELNGLIAGSSEKVGPKLKALNNKITTTRVASPTKGLINKANLKLKTANQVSSSSSGVAKQATSPPVSSSSSPSIQSPTINVSAAATSSTKSPLGSVSPVAASSNKTLLANKKKGLGLNAVIDKLTKGSAPQGPSADGSSTPTASVATEGGLKAESSAQPVPSGSRPDSSSTKANQASALPGKLAESKVKYSRNTSEFTVKQSTGGLKLTVTKTKPSSSSESKPGAKIKPSSSSVKTGAATSSLKAAKSVGLKRPPLGTPFKAGSLKTGQSGGVSSSSAGSSGSPRASNANGPAGKGSKVTSSANGSGANNKNSKITSSSADAILQAALPTLRLDQLPKIPRAAQSNAVASSAAVASSQQVVTQSSIGTSSSSASILPQPTKRVVPRQPSSERPGQDAPQSSMAEPRIDTSSASSVANSGFDRYQQSNAITSSYATNVNNSMTSAVGPSGSTFEGPAISSSGTEEPMQDSAANSSGGNIDNKAGLPVTAGVSSSSDLQPTSTPSSPVETAPVDNLQNVPLIIPTESFEEPDTESSAGFPSIDSSDQVESGGPSLANRDNITSTSLDQRRISESKNSSGSATPLPSGSKDDDDEEGLVIDFAAPKSNEAGNEGDGPATSDPVSSSNNDASGPASPSTSPVINSTPLVSIPTPIQSSATPSSPPPENQPDGPSSPVSNEPAVPDAPNNPPVPDEMDLMDEALLLSAD